MSEILVRPLPEEWRRAEYDLAVATIGYEDRSRYVFDALEIRGLENIASGFAEQQVLQYETNADWFHEHRFLVQHNRDSDYADWFASAIKRISRSANPKRILVDISSLTRVRLAQLIEIFRSSRSPSNVIVTFVYSPAAYNAPVASAPYNSHVGPVTPSFAGWWEEPDKAVATIVGLGYEQDKALGAVEHLQSSYVWLFIPTSDIVQYSSAVAAANQALLDIVPADRKLTYQVNDAYYCYVKLESLIYGIGRTHNPVLLPFGPKIFALCALLVGCIHRHVAVWRVSAGGMEEPVNRTASGFVYGLEVNFTGQDS